jgi:hypothetical protein
MLIFGFHDKISALSKMLAEKVGGWGWGCKNMG